MSETLETTLKKVKNSGYFFVAVLVLNAGMMWQSNKDFTTSQHAINASQGAINERNAQLLQQQTTSITRLEGTIVELKAIVAGQNRRLEMLENRNR